MAEEKEVLLEVKDLNVTYGSGRKAFAAVQNANFQIYKGETFGLVGESGSGKTTIGRAILRILPTSGGEILYKGQKINGKIPRALDKQITREIQMIFQDPQSSLNERAKVSYIVGEGLQNVRPDLSAAQREEKVRQALLDVGLLPEFASRFPHEFSGGQRQRIGIARALIVEPEFIVADEPISALDMSIRAQVLNLLRRLQKERGITYLFIAHDLSVMRYISDRIAVIHKGSIVELADAEELVAHAIHPYTRSLLLTLALLVLPVVSAGAAQPDPTLVQTQTETAEAAQHQYSYIALGDSIVAGIGLPDAVYQRNGRYYDVSGNYQGYSKDCYVARVAEGLGLSRDQTANYGMPALMSGDLLELVRTGSCQSASINFSLPDLRQELKHAQVITVEIGANDVLVPIMYGIASAMGGPQVFEALLPMLEGDFRQMDASSFAALRENLDSLNITAQQRKALLKLLDSGIAEICTQSQATTLANLEALLQELKALNPDAQIVLVGYYNPVPLLPAPANPFVKHFRTLNRSVQKLAQQYDVAFASAAYTLVANDAHPTACGHKYLARQILKALEK